MSESFERSTAGGDEHVQLRETGESAKGEYRCSECSYGVTVHATLPVCPMCAGRSWEPTAWSPFGRAARLR